MFIKITAAMLVVLALVSASPGQSGAATGERIVVPTTSLPKGFLRQPYRFQLEATGGIPPFKWEVGGGALPHGMTLSDDGILSGAPTETGQFHFVVSATDSGKPAHQRTQELTLQVVAPLVVQWSRYPKVTGQRVECAIKLSNQTGQDFDFTVIALAVNETGRATTVGYQHFSLKKDTTDYELTFAENLPRGEYELNVDAVAEVEATNTIYRTRLVTTDKLQLQQGP
jgi:Putative Ig domain